jgi:hypothetical protein
MTFPWLKIFLGFSNGNVNEDPGGPGHFGIAGLPGETLLPDGNTIAESSEQCVVGENPSWLFQIA